MTLHEPAPQPEISMRARLPGPGQSALLRLAIAPVVLIGAVVIGLVPDIPVDTQTHFSRASNAPSTSSPPASLRTVIRSAFPPLPADGAPFLSLSRHHVRLGDVVMGFDIPAEGWESHGLPYVSKSAHGNQGAEAIVYWTALPRGEAAGPCRSILGPLAGATPKTLAQAVASAPGITVISRPLDGLLGGGLSTRLEVRLESHEECVPGYVVKWEPFVAGAMWEDVQRGDTIRIWFVDVQGMLIIVAAATHADAGQRVTREALAIVDSIVFNVIPG